MNRIIVMSKHQIADVTLMILELVERIKFFSPLMTASLIELLKKIENDEIIHYEDLEIIKYSSYCQSECKQFINYLCQ